MQILLTRRTDQRVLPEGCLGGWRGVGLERGGTGLNEQADLHQGASTSREGLWERVADWMSMYRDIVGNLLWDINHDIWEEIRNSGGVIDLFVKYNGG